MGILVAVFVFAATIYGVAAYGLTMRPDHVRVSTNPQSIAFTCTADVALTGCQFSWRDHIMVGPILELSRGFQSKANSTHLDTKITGYSYSGRGLAAGDCGVTLRVIGFNRWMVACRVRAESGAWTYAWADMLAASRDPLPHTLTPRELVVLPGGEASFTMTAQESLYQCNFYPPSLYLDLDDISKSTNISRLAGYVGVQLGDGECGFALANITEADNGPVRGYISNIREDKHDHRFMALIVARRPTAPSLTVVQRYGITATCVVEASRPLPQMTWLLGDDVIRQDLIDDSPGSSSPQDEWRWPWMEGSLMQRVTLRLKPNDNGKVLKCRVSHVTLDQPLEVNETVFESVLEPPKNPDLSLDIIVNDNGPATLNAVCTVEGGQSAANISWYLDGMPLRQRELQFVPDDRAYNVGNPNTTTQTLTRQLSDADIGKELWCVAEHFGLGEGKSSVKIKIHVPMCPPVTSESLLISCYLGGETTDCAQRQHVGSVAHMSCKPGHLLPLDVIITTTTCMRTAEWDQEIFSCSPDCGRRKSNSGLVLISNGEEAKVGEFPWHVGIYRQPVGVRTPVHICGGSLITTRLVLSAAHCFYDNFLDSMRNSSEFKVAAGKHLLGWEDSDPSVQKRNVTGIRHKLFGGRDRNFVSDIALVYLSEPVEVNPQVNMVCVDWEDVFELWHLHPGRFGVVPGWGFTENGSQSNELKYIDLPYVPPDVCYDSLSRELKPILTNDKFCAGYSNESKSVCRGDSGGGLVFLDKRTDKYYLRGVVSVAFKPADFDGVCYSDYYVAFTLVSQYITWIQNNIETYK